MLSCSNAAHFLEIQLVGDGRTDTPSHRDAKRHLKISCVSALKMQFQFRKQYSFKKLKQPIWNAQPVLYCMTCSDTVIFWPGVASSLPLELVAFNWRRERAASKNNLLRNFSLAKGISWSIAAVNWGWQGWTGTGVVEMHGWLDVDGTGGQGQGWLVDGWMDVDKQGLKWLR